MTKQRVIVEIEKVTIKIKELQKRLEELNQIKKSLDDTEYLETIYKNQISLETLKNMIEKEKAIQKRILESKKRGEKYEE